MTLAPPAPVHTSTIVVPRTRRRSPRSVRKAALGVLGIVGFLGCWQLVAMAGIVSPTQLPSAVDTFSQLAKMVTDLEFWRNVGRTMTAWLIGLAIAAVLGIALGALVGMIPFLRRATHSMVEFLRPIPSVALIPLAILAYGIQIQAALVIIVYACFWQVFVQVLYGVADIDTVARDTARSFGLTRSAQLRSLVLPTALPYIFTGLRLAAAVALILAVTAEMTIGNPGLGRTIVQAYNVGNITTVYAIVLVTGVLGLIVNLGFRAIERRALAWHQSVRGEEIL
ncbi:ABC transporter permease [Microbacterium sp. cx-55]|uniref:ABC transporter permease n=1 Tax=Microbacterium sp. cx-55 TaxID=2875948 RepID=UPI001CBEB461|nr:ABC transporter permease [Microbacterium sp. cx-55]MBZ4488361.1 ABC transporter permease [Microbacterium sp. cx-55]UGB35014.1 ABC transporter permease [Microbacterium sp. cx-55]